ncbi:imidazolonepropionase [Antarcticibacterium flavum]|uniref:Imidazolonepropionase n=1 Tax=Antarcticibacterium flavum TaxID=2058175 RepID=A0A5B7X7X2_9FLAO|nr:MULTISPECIES: imidazolonepropionase [Antarcticibacterium]MCM4159626.1 imidazolonepropionase [Antarcticibacterium sp. W02-3]QCY70872.1 imidazolonepropionase [Antarcticibacterium flavum]
MKALYINIQDLVQVRKKPIEKLSGREMKELPTIQNAWLLTENGTITDFGHMDDLPKFSNIKDINLEGKIVLPAWCDSHTHIVYAGNREQEFVDRINGLTYEEVANRGGGILNSARTLQETTEEELYRQSSARLEEVIKLGTGAIEIKSGYGLTKEAELKMLRVIKKLKENYEIPIKATFLGAHALPNEYKEKREEYIDFVIKEILPDVANQKLADYIDIFCEKGYFTIKDTNKLLQAGKRYGLTPKIHVNQFNAIGGVKAGVEHDALSVDHLEVMREEDIEVLKGTSTMPVALPGCSLFLGIPYTPARQILDAGLPLALATDYNPGSAPSGNMNLVVSLACIKMKMTPEEAINAATINAAFAMGLSKTHGSITKGKAANFIITKKIPSYSHLPYSFGNNEIEAVYINGKKFN